MKQFKELYHRVLQENGFSMNVALLLAVLTGMLVSVRHYIGVSIPSVAMGGVSLLLFVLAGALALRRDGIRGMHINYPLLLFVVLLAVSCFIGFDRMRFLRFMSMAIGMLLFSPMVDSGVFRQVRRVIAVSVWATMALSVVVSFLLWIALTLFGLEVSYTFRAAYCGIFKIGMLLSPAAALVVIGSYWMLLEGVGRISTGSRIGLILLALIGCVMCVVAGSRIAVLGLAVALLFESLSRRKALIELLKDRRIRIFGLAGLVAFILVLPNLTEAIRIKNSGRAAHGNIFYSRSELWQLRWEEFCSSPFTGIGYAREFPESADILASINRVTREDILARGSLEPGTSWLTILSYSGIAGLLLFGWFAVGVCRYLYINRRKPIPMLQTAVLIFLFVNGLCEGWLLFAGSLMFPVFWLACCRYDT